MKEAAVVKTSRPDLRPPGSPPAVWAAFVAQSAWKSWIIVALLAVAFLPAVAKRYGVPELGRHYILIPCAGVTIGVDDLKRDGLRRVHVFTDRKGRAPELSAVVPEVKGVAARLGGTEIVFVDRHGAKNHERRYVGWEWKVGGRAVGDDIALACELIEALRKAWLGRA